MIVDTTGGKVRGTRSGPITAFRGIPYPAPSDSCHRRP